MLLIGRGDEQSILFDPKVRTAQGWRFTCRAGSFTGADGLRPSLRPTEIRSDLGRPERDLKLSFVREKKVFEAVAIEIEKVEGAGIDGGKGDARRELEIGVFPGF